MREFLIIHIIGSEAQIILIAANGVLKQDIAAKLIQHAYGVTMARGRFMALVSLTIL